MTTRAQGDLADSDVLAWWNHHLASVNHCRFLIQAGLTPAQHEKRIRQATLRHALECACDATTELGYRYWAGILADGVATYKAKFGGPIVRLDAGVSAEAYKLVKSFHMDEE